MNLVDSIWIVGSSIIKRSEQFAKSSPEFGTDLSLTDVTVLLKGRPELHFVICMISFLICLLQSHTHGFSLYIAKHDNPLRRHKCLWKLLSTSWDLKCLWLVLSGHIFNQGYIGVMQYLMLLRTDQDEGSIGLLLALF